MTDADAAVARLKASGVRAEDLCTFSVNPAGEHHALPAGGDRDASPGAPSVDGIIRLFEECSARQVERTEGRWENGAWADFDPLAPPRLVGGRDLRENRAAAPPR